jgi:pyridoxine 5-phosphate synthase
LIAEQAGADGITAHLREDRRHMQDRDMYLLKDMIHTRLNFEMAVTDEMLNIASKVKPFAAWPHLTDVHFDSFPVAWQSM